MFLIEKGVCLWVSLVMKVLLGGVLCLGGLEKGFFYLVYGGTKVITIFLERHKLYEAVPYVYLDTAKF